MDLVIKKKITPLIKASKSIINVFILLIKQLLIYSILTLYHALDKEIFYCGEEKIGNSSSLRNCLSFQFFTPYCSQHLSIISTSTPRLRKSRFFLHRKYTKAHRLTHDTDALNYVFFYLTHLFGYL